MTVEILCIDVGSTTQDILLLDTAQRIENSIQLVLPSPTILVARAIEAATHRRETILLTGETMGGGACTSAIRRHLDAGLEVYATENAARSFRDDLREVASWGIRLESAGEIARHTRGTLMSLADLDLARLGKALSAWDVTLKPDVVAVAVLDHGVAPAGESERLWRFRYLEQFLTAKGTLEAFVFLGSEVPSQFTRMQAVARPAGSAPLVLMDTGAAAVLGASLDPLVGRHENRLAVNLGNSHTIAFHLSGSRVLGFFEHHTSMLTRPRLEALLSELAQGTLGKGEVWEEGGHGSLIIEKGASPFLAATGPRRSLLDGSKLNPYFAAPFGSMMLTGCYGLLKAVSMKLPQWRGEIEKTLSLS
ncbi:MAG: DUF1786 domain-containing protein [Chloroflexi bacterium]|nr:DUF1786 domain-containing protein [Chloroflexota bacterium]